LVQPRHLIEAAAVRAPIISGETTPQSMAARKDTQCPSSTEPAPARGRRTLRPSGFLYGSSDNRTMSWRPATGPEGSRFSRRMPAEFRSEESRKTPKQALARALLDVFHAQLTTLQRRFRRFRATESDSRSNLHPKANTCVASSIRPSAAA